VIENHVSAWLGMILRLFLPEFSGPAWSAIMALVTVALIGEEMSQAQIGSTDTAFSRA
jgi:hypothetical protein